MKDHVEIGHLTKNDAFRVNRDQVMDLEIRFKIHTNRGYYTVARRYEFYFEWQNNILPTSKASE